INKLTSRGINLSSHIRYTKFIKELNNLPFDAKSLKYEGVYLNEEMLESCKKLPSRPDDHYYEQILCIGEAKRQRQNLIEKQRGLAEKYILRELKKPVERYSPSELRRILTANLDTEEITESINSEAQDSDQKTTKKKQYKYPSFFTLARKMKNTSGAEMHKYFGTETGKEAWNEYQDYLDNLYKKGEIKPLDIIITHYLMPKTQSIFGLSKGPKTIMNLGCGRDLLGERMEEPATPQMKGSLQDWLGNKGVGEINIVDLDHVASSDSVMVGDISTMVDSGKIAQESADLAIFSLSLRGTNIGDNLIQCSMALKPDGKLLIGDHKNVFNKEEREKLVDSLLNLGFSRVSSEEVGDYFFLLAMK
nr:hypothetical protein [Candidatus Caenarcaniphilales bacterium]